VGNWEYIARMNVQCFYDAGHGTVVDEIGGPAYGLCLSLWTTSSTESSMLLKP
jgi:hypothetical protein